MRKRYCVDCGKPVDGGRQRCPECALKWRRDKKQLGEEIASIVQPSRLPYTRMNREIDALNYLAGRVGMSYGRFVAAFNKKLDPPPCRGCREKRCVIWCRACMHWFEVERKRLKWRR